MRDGGSNGQCISAESVKAWVIILAFKLRDSRLFHAHELCPIQL